MAATAKYIPGYLQSRYPTIRIDPQSGSAVSSTPVAPWGQFHSDMEAANGGGTSYIPPTPPGTARDRYGNLIGSSAPFIKPLPVVKDPFGAAAGDSLLSAFNRYSGEANSFDFGSMLKDLQAQYQTGQSKVNSAYNDQQAALDPTQWANNRSGLDASLGDLTDRYAGDAGALRDRYGNVLSGYEQSGGRIVGDILNNGQRYIDTIIPQQRDQALGDALTYLDKYGIQNAGAGGGTGASSGGATLAGRAVSEAVLPYMAQAEQMQQELRRNVALPFQSDIANRRIGQIGSDYQMQGDVYNRYAGVNSAQRSTEDAIYGAKQAAAAGKVQSAVAQLMSTGIGIQQMAQILQLPIQLIAQQAQALSGIMGIRNTATQFGVEDIRGYNVTQPQNSPLSRPDPYQPGVPNVLPDRYAPAPTSTGTLPAPAATAGPRYDGGGTYTLPNDYTWGRTPTQQNYFEQVQRQYE